MDEISTFYRIYDRYKKEEVEVYFQFGDNKKDFHSPKDARSSNCHGIYEDKHRYGIRKYKKIISMCGVDVDGIQCDYTKKKSGIEALTEAFSMTLHEHIKEHKNEKR